MKILLKTLCGCSQEVDIPKGYDVVYMPLVKEARVFIYDDGAGRGMYIDENKRLFKSTGEFSGDLMIYFETL